MNRPILILLLCTASLAGANTQSGYEFGLTATWNAGAFDSGISPQEGSLRIRTPGGIVLEPRLTIGASEFELAPDQFQEAESVGGGLTVRLPLASRRGVDLQALLEAGAHKSRDALVDDEFGYEIESRSFYSAWGLALEWRAKPRVALGLDATSEVYSVRRYETHETDESTTSRSWGPLFSPRLRANVTLYF